MEGFVSECQIVCKKQRKNRDNHLATFLAVTQLFKHVMQDSHFSTKGRFLTISHCVVTSLSSNFLSFYFHRS